MHEESFSLEDADKLDQIQLINKFMDVGKDKIPFEKVIFKKMSDYLLVQEEKFLIYKSKIFSRKNLDEIPKLKPALDPKLYETPKSTKTKTRHKNSPLKSRKQFLNEIVHNKKNNALFQVNFRYQDG